MKVRSRIWERGREIVLHYFEFVRKILGVRLKKKVYSGRNVAKCGRVAKCYKSASWKKVRKFFFIFKIVKNWENFIKMKIFFTWKNSMKFEKIHKQLIKIVRKWAKFLKIDKNSQKMWKILKNWEILSVFLKFALLTSKLYKNFREIFLRLR